jgi:hypothetical protein
MAVFTLIFVSYAVTSHAHNLWVVGNANNNGDGTVHLYFEHFVGPGDGAYNGPIKERGRTWFRAPDAKSRPVDMREVAVKDTKYLVGNTGPTTGSFAVDHTTLWGIYHGRLDFFHGRYIEATDTKGLGALAESPHLPVQIVPEWTEKGLLLRVMYFSNPRPRADLWVVKSDGTEESFTADNKGEFLLGPVAPGVYHINTRVNEKEAAGAFENEAYKGIIHGSTLTINLPVAFGN